MAKKAQGGAVQVLEDQSQHLSLSHTEALSCHPAWTWAPLI